MASTQQGARDFIQNNWDKAVVGLNHVHLLLPGLRTTRVLDENEISDIDSCNERFEKNRKVLSMIVKKGNAACEVFLNLLDTKRKWSLDGGAHDWIDCFNFDGSGPYRAQLKLAAREIVESKWKNSRKLLAKYVKELQFKYTPLVLVNDVSDVYPENKYKKSRKKKCKRYIPKEDKPINIEDLLTMKEKKILLVGKPGIGKTFCVLQLLNLWAESIEDTLYVFYFDAGSARHVRDSEDLRSLLFSYCKPERMIEDDLYTDIVNGNANVLLIFDSFDEIQPTCQDEKIERVIYGILNKYELEKAKVIVTCRPSLEERELPDWADCRVEVRGFGEKSISEYFKTTLEGQCMSSVSVMSRSTHS
ncbi:nucleotide-binding oligomerization domain-containing protein 2-like [Polypterus senegalus]|uniref:nucleotide-binding oligomerization domain-containing protein 2-like n=1 Tax=Polypterus senegalus TaxID=55291 RepID=UPI00196325FC|nr:nucleotide-binding oligomerization domain-containing protein 2-like [Polypterus senegalus]